MKERPKKNCLNCGVIMIKPLNFGRTKWDKKKYCCRGCSAKHYKRKPHTEEFKKSVSSIHKGKVLSLETRKKMSLCQLGEKNNNWKGGVSPKHKLIRMSMEYKLWREAVLKRDNYTCIWCGRSRGWSKKEKKQVKIQADHIKPFAYYPELRFAIDNGRTLCLDCHKTTNTYGASKNKQTKCQQRWSNN